MGSAELALPRPPKEAFRTDLPFGPVGLPGAWGHWGPLYLAWGTPAMLPEISYGPPTIYLNLTPGILKL